MITYIVNSVTLLFGMTAVACGLALAYSPEPPEDSPYV